MKLEELHEGQRVLSYGTVIRVGVATVDVAFDNDRTELRTLHAAVLQPSDEPRPWKVGDLVLVNVREYPISHLYTWGESAAPCAMLRRNDGTEFSILVRHLTLVRPAS